MKLDIVFGFLATIVLVNSEYYHSYYERPLTPEEYGKFEISGFLKPRVINLTRCLLRRTNAKHLTCGFLNNLLEFIELASHKPAESIHMIHEDRQDRENNVVFQQTESRSYAEIRIDIFICAKDITYPCSRYEGRRIDGSCNNLEEPAAGMAHKPYHRLLPAEYGPDFGMSRAQDGSPLPLARLVRTVIVPNGEVRSPLLNPASTHYGEMIVQDVTTVKGFEISLFEKRYCCTPQGLLDPNCIPQGVPRNDPSLSRRGINCLNMTRVQALQDFECLPNNVQREQVNFATPLIDMSNVYGTNISTTNYFRSFRRGQFRMVTRNGRKFPPNVKSVGCAGNHLNETTCFGFGEHLGNFDLRLTLTIIWFIRLHNMVAAKLAKINPCWDDQKLFDVTRQINIAVTQNIYLYEWTPLFTGKQVLLDKKVVYNEQGRIYDYDPHIKPHILVEFITATKAFHSMIDGRIEARCPVGDFISSRSFSGQLGRPAVVDHDVEGYTRGTFLQGASALDGIVDPDISDHFLRHFQDAADLITIDIARARDFGVPPYHKYREMCDLPPAHSFEDFLDVMSWEAVERLKSVYSSYKDVEMLPGVYSERAVKGARVGHTLRCIMIHQNLAWRRGDRFWFENGEHETSFNDAQIKEIRKMFFAGLACCAADGIREIQPRAFLLPGPGNEQVSCQEIPLMDLTKWKDNSCNKNVA